MLAGMPQLSAKVPGLTVCPRHPDSTMSLQVLLSSRGESSAFALWRCAFTGVGGQKAEQQHQVNILVVYWQLCSDADGLLHLSQ